MYFSKTTQKVKVPKHKKLNTFLAQIMLPPILGKKLICINSCMGSRLNFPLKLLCFLLPLSFLKDCALKTFYCLLIFHISSSHLSIGKCLMPRMAQIQDEAPININQTAASRQNQEEGNIYSKNFTAQLRHKLRQKR